MKIFLNRILATFAIALIAISVQSHATIVEFQTSHGSFKVNLHDKTTPLTVQNFLKYIESDRYNDTVIHRKIDNFVVQGGGFTFNNKLPLNGITTYDPVKNEPIYSNIRGTIAMAKQDGKPDSATSQWFINLSNNSQNLDVSNGGFTVFGEVIEDGMDVIDVIAALPRCGTTPVTDNAASICENPGVNNFVTVYQIIVIDVADDSDTNLNSVKNTLINQPPTSNKGSDGGGSVFWLLLMLVAVAFRQQKN